MSIAHIEYSLNRLSLVNQEANKRIVCTFHVYTAEHLDSKRKKMDILKMFKIIMHIFQNYHIDQVYEKRNQFQKFLICLVYKPAFDRNTIFKLNDKNGLVFKEQK
jgi:hypothetical protein